MNGCCCSKAFRFGRGVKAGKGKFKTHLLWIRNKSILYWLDRQKHIPATPFCGGKISPLLLRSFACFSIISKKRDRKPKFLVRVRRKKVFYLSIKYHNSTCFVLNFDVSILLTFFSNLSGSWYITVFVNYIKKQNISKVKDTKAILLGL